MLLRLCLLVVCLVAPMFAQGDYVLAFTKTLAAGSTAITIQQPTGSSNFVRFQHVTISTDAAIKITIERDCSTAATTTAATLVATNPRTVKQAAKALAFTDSNASGCTVVGGPHTIPAGGAVTIGLSRSFMDKNGAGQSLTVRTGASETATVTFNLAVTEERQ